MLHDAGINRMELSSQMLVNCFSSQKVEGKGWWTGKGRLEGKTETDVRNQKIPCCHVWMQHWLRSKRRKRKREETVSFWLCCAVQSGLGALLTARDWWIELCIVHNINSVLLSLSFWISLPHHSSLRFPSPALPLSLSLSLSLSLPLPPSLLPLLQVPCLSLSSVLVSKRHL